MTTQRRIAIIGLGSPLCAFAVLAGGCGIVIESEQAACLRALTHLDGCLKEASGVGFPVPPSQACEAGIEPAARGVSAVADCVTSLSCEQLLGEEPSDPASTSDCLAMFGMLPFAKAAYGGDDARKSVDDPNCAERIRGLNQEMGQ